MHVHSDLEANPHDGHAARPELDSLMCDMSKSIVAATAPRTHSARAPAIATSTAANVPLGVVAVRMPAVPMPMEVVAPPHDDQSFHLPEAVPQGPQRQVRI